MTHNYVYDAIGNILEKAGITYSYGDLNHPSAVTSLSDGKSYTYDANGNTVTGAGRTMVWDVDNRLSSVSASGGTALMSYDYTGIRVKKDSPSGITYYPFSGYEDTGGIITKYIKIGNEIIGASKGGEKLFYHNDHLGGVNVITDIWAARVQLVEYDPWGKVSREEGSGDDSRRFTGQMLEGNKRGRESFLDMKSSNVIGGGHYAAPPSTCHRWTSLPRSKPACRSDGAI